MDDDAACERLVRVEGDLEALAQLVGRLVPRALVGDDLEQAARRLQRAGTRREAMPREQRRHQPGPRRRAGMERLGHGAELLAQAHRLRRCDAERHGTAAFVQAEDAGAAGRRAQHAGGPGDVPAAVVVVGVHHVADAARHVDAQHQRIDHVAPGRAALLRQREHGRCDRARRMDDRLQVRVVEVEGVRRDAVDQRRARHVDALAAAEHGGLRRRLQHGHSRQRGVGRLVAGGTDRAAEPVVERAVRLVLHSVVPAARRVAGHESRQDAGDRRCLHLGGDPGVLRHACLIPRAGSFARSSAQCRSGCSRRTDPASWATARQPRPPASRSGRATSEPPPACRSGA